MTPPLTIKTLPTRKKTTKVGVYYKQIVKISISSNGEQKEKEIDKVYSIQFKDRHGKWRIQTVGKHSEGVREKDCVNKRAELLLENKDSVNEVTIEGKNKYKFDSIASKYLESIEFTLKDYKNIKGRYNNHIKPIFEEKEIYSITEDDLLFLQRNMMETHSPKTINHVLGDIGRIFSYAIKKRKMKLINPTIEVDNLKVSNARERFLDTDEVKLLLNHLKGDRVLRFFVILSLTTGGRVATIFNIRKVDVNLKNSSINLYDFKNESQYVGFISREFFKEIEKTIEYLDKTDFLIHEDDAKTMQYELQKYLDMLFNNDLEKEDRKNRAVPHTLRHSFASNLASKGTPIFTIQKLMNHKDINMTLRYAKLAPDNGQKEVWDLY